MKIEKSIFFFHTRTGDDGMKSLERQISVANNEVTELTNTFISARNELLRLQIEKRMDEMEIYLADLKAQKAQIELERGLKITKPQIIAHVQELLKGDPNDKEYQKMLIDHLLYKVYVYDDDTIVCYFNFNVGEKDQIITANDTAKAIEKAPELAVREPSHLVTHPRFERGTP